MGNKAKICGLKDKSGGKKRKPMIRKKINLKHMILRGIKFRGEEKESKNTKKEQPKITDKERINKKD